MTFAARGDRRPHGRRRNHRRSHRADSQDSIRGHRRLSLRHAQAHASVPQDSAALCCARRRLAEFAPYAIPSDLACPCDPAIFWRAPASGRATSRFVSWALSPASSARPWTAKASPLPTARWASWSPERSTKRLFHAIARSIPEGTWEFVCHPGYNDADLQAGKTRLRESRETELARPDPAGRARSPCPARALN